ncbi:hypothetical protein V2W45_1341742 [Cenococcum geophilum]
MEDNKNKRPKRKLRALRYKRKATPSKVEDNKDIGSNTGVAPVIAIQKTRLYAPTLGFALTLTASISAPNF